MQSLLLFGRKWLILDLSKKPHVARKTRKVDAGE